MSVETLPPPPNYIALGATIKADNSSINSKDVRGKIMDYLKTDTARDHIMRDIQDLSSIITSIESDFETVASWLITLDEKNIVSHKFAPEWRKLHDEYTALMLKSQCGVNDASNRIATLVDVLVPAFRKVDQPLNIKQGMLKEYIKGLQPFEDQAKVNAHQFLRLGQSVTEFRRHLKQRVESEHEEMNHKFEEVEKVISKHWHGVHFRISHSPWNVLHKILHHGDKRHREEKVVVSKFEEIEAHITTLEATLQKLSHVERGWHIVKTIFPLGDHANREEIGGIVSLVDIAPTVGKEMMEIALRYIDSKLAEELKTLQQGTDVASTKKALSNLRFALEQRGHIHNEFLSVLQSLVDLDPTFTGMSDKISKIEGIWLMLLKDSQALLSQLSQMTDTEYELAFDQHLETLTATYKALKFSLDKYSLAVPKRNIAEYPC